MSRLSIIIPALADAARLENTLVSVLQNRPDDCEILVACTAPYSDPYQLQGEVRFLSVAANAGWVGSVNAALAHSSAPVVHVLTSGVEVTDGWTKAPLAHFYNPRVGAVTPIVRDAKQPNQVLATGVRYRAGGKREVLCMLPAKQTAHPAQGPSAYAGFYRKAALVALGGLDRSAGDSLADVDTALLLQHAGWSHTVEAGSEIFATPELLPIMSSFHEGLCAERMFWRTSPAAGWKRSPIEHGLHLAGELLTAPARPGNLARLAGRFFGSLQLGHIARHRYRLQSVVGQADSMQPRPRRLHLRVDGKHPTDHAADRTSERTGERTPESR